MTNGHSNTYFCLLYLHCNPQHIMMQGLLRAAEAVAISSSGTGKNGHNKLGAILFDKRGKIHAARTNSYKTHPYLKRYYAYPHLHAESACILAQGIDHCENLQMLVVRSVADIRHNRRLCMSRPCVNCQRFARDVGIKNIYYTDWQGAIQML